MGDFHELTGDLTREQLNRNPYQCGARVGKAALERDPRSWPQKLARGVSLVNGATGERVCVPKGASRVFFVDGDV